MPEFIHIDPSTANYNTLISKFNNDVGKGKHIYLFVYMDGCGPCEATKLQWAQIMKHLKPEVLKNDTVVIAKINQKLFNTLKNVGKEPMGYPCLRYIKGMTVQEYEDSGISKIDRSPESFAEWIDSKLKQTQVTSKKRSSKKSKTRKKKNKNKNKNKNNNNNKHNKYTFKSTKL